MVYAFRLLYKARICVRTCQSRVFSLCPGSQARGPVPLVCLDLSAAYAFRLVLPTLGAHMDADYGSLMRHAHGKAVADTVMVVTLVTPPVTRT